MTTDEEQETMNEYGEKILTLEVSIYEISDRLKKLKKDKKALVTLYRDFMAGVNLRADATTLEDFEGEEDEETEDAENDDWVRIQGLTDAPINDPIFKRNLDNANLATITDAIEIIYGMPRCKARLKMLNSRKKQLMKEGDAGDTDQEDSA